MTTYDPAAPTHHDLSAPTRHATPDAVAARDSGPMSTLEELRAAVGQVAEVVEHEFPDLVLYSPGEVIRLTCTTEVEHAAWKAIQIAAMPPAYRRKRIPDPRKIDEVRAFADLIGEHTTEIALRCGDGTYKPLGGTFDDVAVLGAFGVAEAPLAVLKIFGGSDAYLLHAGRELVEAAGLGERRPGEAGDEDPT